MLDDLKGNVDAGGFGVGFHEGILTIYGSRLSSKISWSQDTDSNKLCNIGKDGQLQQVVRRRLLKRLLSALHSLLQHQ